MGRWRKRTRLKTLAWPSSHSKSSLIHYSSHSFQSHHTFPLNDRILHRPRQRWAVPGLEKEEDICSRDLSLRPLLLLTLESNTYRTHLHCLQMEISIDLDAFSIGQSLVRTQEPTLPFFLTLVWYRCCHRSLPASNQCPTSGGHLQCRLTVGLLYI